MKKLLLFILVALACMPMLRAESFTAGGETFTYTVKEQKTLSSGVTHHRLRFTSPVTINVNIVTADLSNSDVRVEAFLGQDKLMKTEKMTTGFTRRKNAGRNPIACQNAHFWSMSTQTGTDAGVYATTTCLGGAMVNGEIVTETNSYMDQYNGGPADNGNIFHGVMGITKEGKAYIGNYQTLAKVVCTTRGINYLTASEVNKYCHAQEVLAMFTPLYPSDRAIKIIDSSAGQAGKDVTGSVESTELYLTLKSGQTVGYNKEIKTTVAKKGSKEASITRGAYDFVLVAAPGTNKTWLDKIQVGDEVILQYNWYDCTNAANVPNFENLIAGNAIVMKNGAITSRATNEYYNSRVYSRSAYGVSADNTKLIMCVIDNKADATYGSSSGCNTTRMSYIMKHFGADDVLNCDAGGSAQMVVGGNLVNTPSDGSERAVASGIMVYSNSGNTGGEIEEGDLADVLTFQDCGTSAISQLSGKTVRRTIINGNYMYILAVDSSNEPTVLVYDLVNKSVLRTLGTTAATTIANASYSFNYMKLSDIALTSDGVLIGINKTYQAFATATFSGAVKIYKWANDANGIATGELSEWFSTNFAGNWSYGVAGETMAYTGSSTAGTLVYSGTDASATTGRTRLAIVTVSGGIGTAIMRNNQDGTYLMTTYMGSTFKMNYSPRSTSNLIFTSANAAPFELTLNATNTGVPTILTSLSSVAPNAGVFKYGNYSLMVAPAMSGTSCEGVKLLNITDGLSSATQVASKNVSAGAVTVHAVGRSYSASNGTKVDMYLLHGLNLTKYSTTEEVVEEDTYETVTPTASGTANPFAFEITGVRDGDNLTVNYVLNAPATGVAVVFKNSNGEIKKRVTLGSNYWTEAAHSATIDVSDLAVDSYTWGIEVTGEAKTGVQIFKDLGFNHPQGIDMDCNMESPYFGRIYVTEGRATSKSTHYSGTNGGQGLYVFTPRFIGIQNWITGKYVYSGGVTFDQTVGATTGADFRKVRVTDDSRVFVTRQNDSGNYLYELPDIDEMQQQNAVFSQVFTGGALNTTNYLYEKNGTFIAGPNVGFDVKGTGEDLTLAMLSGSTKLFGGTNMEDARVDEYELGESSTWSSAPSSAISALSGKYTINFANANLCYDDQGGIWYCQYRDEPSTTQPALVYVDENGDELYKDITNARGGAAIRFNRDFTQIAISSTTNSFSIYNITYKTDGTPVLDEQMRIVHGMGKRVNDLAWDLANNIYAVGNNGEIMRAFSIPRSNNTVTIDAPSMYMITIGDPVGVEEVETDADAPVEYYNLQGIKVENPAGGIFIKKQGNKTTKVVL